MHLVIILLDILLQILVGRIITSSPFFGSENIIALCTQDGRDYICSGFELYDISGNLTYALTVNNATQNKFQAILGDTSADYLASIAAYVSFSIPMMNPELTLSQADTYRSTKAGTFSAPFHYIDALDNPPHSCGVDYARDCGVGGCVVSAISNYVSLVSVIDKSVLTYL